MCHIALTGLIKVHSSNISNNTFIIKGLVGLDRVVYNTRHEFSLLFDSAPVLNA